jgi:hypothetical protein
MAGQASSSSSAKPLAKVGAAAVEAVGRVGHDQVDAAGGELWEELARVALEGGAPAGAAWGRRARARQRCGTRASSTAVAGSARRGERAPAGPVRAAQAAPAGAAVAFGLARHAETGSRRAGERQPFEALRISRTPRAWTEVDFMRRVGDGVVPDQQVAPAALATPRGRHEGRKPSCTLSLRRRSPRRHSRRTRPHGRLAGDPEAAEGARRALCGPLSL